MKIRVGMLRRLITEAVEEMDEMKLGIADSNPPGRYFGLSDETEEPTSGVRLRTSPPATFGPGEEWKSWNDSAPNVGNWSSDEEDTDEDLSSWVRDNSGEDTMSVDVELDDDTIPNTVSRR